MKRQYLAAAMGLLLAAAAPGASFTTAKVQAETISETAEAKDEGEDPEAKSILGEVKEVGPSSLTIAVGTRKERDFSEGPQTEGSGGQPEGKAPGEEAGGQPPEEMSGEAPSMLDLTGEELEIPITQDTRITRRTMGNGPLASGDDAPPEMPERGDGQGPSGQAEGQEPPSQGQPPQEGELSQNTDSNSEEITLSAISEGDLVSVTLDNSGNAVSIQVQSMEIGQMGGQMEGAPATYTAVHSYDQDEVISGTSLDSSGTDENAALITGGAEVSMNSLQISRASQDSTGGDSASFYGVGAAVLATDGTAYIKDSAITTDAAGGAGLFAYGDGAIYAADTLIQTQQDTSGGIHAAGGGSLYAWDLQVETNGASSAAIRSDRGGGTMVVDGGSYTSNGSGSPAVYCTADISIGNAALSATGSEAVCVEGLNSLRLYDCSLRGSMPDLSQNDNTWTVILYQSMSGDSQVGNSTFQMKGGSIDSQNGGLFYTTNTECTITLKDVDITASDDCEFFLQCTGNTNKRGWGQAGANGSDCRFTADSQQMKGDVIWDSISTLAFSMTNGSSLTGAVIHDETYAGDGGDGGCSVIIDSSSSWIVTGDSALTSLSCEGSITDENQKTVTILGEDGTLYQEGDSPYTITVKSYENTADLSEASSIEDWSSYCVQRPANL